MQREWCSTVSRVQGTYDDGPNHLLPSSLQVSHLMRSCK
uniref:Uncharacterized protein n=1 Tax=Arundo donax TaxID=35708 RepID=A0A0A9HM78_ARUDO